MTDPNYYDIGDGVRLRAAFTSNGLEADPTGITLRLKDPSGNIDIYTYALGEIIRTGTGTYRRDILIDESGDWFYRFEGTGAVEAADEKRIVGEVSEF